MKKVLFISVLFFQSVLFAQVKKVELSQEFKGAGKGKPTPLAQLKDQELHLRWTECAKTAPAVFNSHKEIRGWIALTWLHCLEQEQKKKNDPLVLEKPLATMSQHRELFAQGPWSSELSQRWINLRLLLLEKQVQKKVAKAAAGFEELLENSWSLDKEQKARVFQGLGDLALAKLQYGEARFLYEEAQNQKDSKYLQEKIDFLQKAAGDEVPVKTPESVSTEAGAGDEVRIEERLRLSLKQNDSLNALKDVMLILNQYPGSRSAKRLKDKPLDIYGALSEKNTREKALDEMAEADGVRILEWAQNLHRRGDSAGALTLAKRFILKNSTSPQMTSALWIAGRSAHFLGQYDAALEFFNSLITYHVGSDEAAEALFRSALIHYRRGHFSSASALLEKLLLQGRERYDLVARYWLVRSLEEVQSDRTKQAAAELIEKYPFSYYGLRLRAESRGGVYSWPDMKEKAPSLPQNLYLAGEQKKSWQRFKELSHAGWVKESQAELAQLPYIKSPLLKMALAQQLARQQQYATAIRLVNEAMEKDVRLRREEFVKIGYPEAYGDLYRAEADRYGVQANLLRSLTRQESAFNLQAVSTSNALGLMQMIPPTAQEVARKLGLKVELPEDMFRPEVNIPMGSFYVSQMLGQFEGHVPMALAAYNAGPNRLKSWLDSREDLRELLAKPSSAPQAEVWIDELPWSETSFYVKAILRNVLLYRLVLEGSFTPKPVLWQDLLNKKSK